MRKFIISAALVAIGVASQARVIEDFKPSETNQTGREYPQVNSQGCVRASIKAHEASRVLLDIGGVKYEMTRDAEGVWTGESAPQQEGFHYYQLNVDGVDIPDPGTRIYYGAGRLGSGVEVPARDLYQFAQKLFR